MTTVGFLIKLSHLGDQASHIKRIPLIVSLKSSPSAALAVLIILSQIITSLFFALALFSSGIRIALKLRRRCPILLDDYILLFGVLCLIAATAAMHLMLVDTYSMMAISSFEWVSGRMSYSQVVEVTTSAAKHLDIFHCLVWTSIFAVKFSFLVFFKDFMDRMESRRAWAYWVTVCVGMGLAWVYNLASPFIGCRYFGEEAGECARKPCVY